MRDGADVSELVDEVIHHDEPAEPGSRPREIAVGVGVVVLGIAILLGAQTLLPESGRDAFGPRWWPSGLAIVLIGLGSLLTVTGGFRPAAATEEPPTRQGAVRLLLLLALVVAYGAAWQYIHFVPVTIVLAAAGAAILGARGWKALVAFPMIVTVVLYGLFGILLGVPL